MQPNQLDHRSDLTLHSKKPSNAMSPEDLAGSIRLDPINAPNSPFSQEPPSESDSDDDYLEDQD